MRTQDKAGQSVATFLLSFVCNVEGKVLTGYFFFNRDKSGIIIRTLNISSSFFFSLMIKLAGL